MRANRARERVATSSARLLGRPSGNARERGKSGRRDVTRLDTRRHQSDLSGRRAAPRHPSRLTSPNSGRTSARPTANPRALSGRTMAALSGLPTRVIAPGRALRARRRSRAAPRDGARTATRLRASADPAAPAPAPEVLFDPEFVGKEGQMDAKMAEVQKTIAAWADAVTHGSEHGLTVRRDARARRCSGRDHPGSVSVPTTCRDDLPPGLGLR